MDERLDWPAAECACLGPGYSDVDCMCGRDERALRAFCRGDLTEMTAAQREWCVNEVARVEGYSESDARQAGADGNLAQLVLNAWTDYCRDKGLL